MATSGRHVLCVAALFAILLCESLAADTAATPPHKHDHHHHHSKERLQDGSYAPRDAHHHDHSNAAGDEDIIPHNSEFDHEAILGSVRTAEEFDNLSPAEAKARLAKLLPAMDLNKDTFVDRHELKTWILRSFRKLAEEEAADRYAEVDENRDGQLTWAEYLQGTYSMADENGTRTAAELQSPHVVEEDKLIGDDKRMFKAADVNGNGVLDAEEFVAFISPEEFAHMLPVILEQTLREKDANGDGRLDFQEFIGASAASHDKEWLVAEKDKFDEDHDHDGDGTLNGNEILSWVVPSNE